ncbi:MAG: glutamate decarboxylase [Bacillota bacterium]
MWTVVYIAPNRAIAQMLKDILSNEGVLVVLRTAGIPHLGEAAHVEVLVPEGEAQEAHDILCGVLGR